MIEDIIRNYTKHSCEEPENMLSPSFFTEHLLVVSEYAEKLCTLLGGDHEIVRISSYLHDISAVLDFTTLPTHNVNSADLAESILNQHDYPKDKTEKVKQCILKHAVPMKIGDGTVEEVCLSNADAISQIVNPTYWLYFAFKIRSLDFAAGRAWYLQKIGSNWDALIEPARRLVEDKYVLVRKALE
jgi:uncharacterized protein